MTPEFNTASAAPASPKIYSPPQLTVFGPLKTLTQGGTGTVSESKNAKPTPLCGRAYAATIHGQNC